MGADITLRSVHNKNYDKYEEEFKYWVDQRNKLSQGMEDTKEYKDIQKKVVKYSDLMYSKGYFRDSYNDSNLLWKLDMSWWDLCKKYQNDNGMVEPKNLEIILKDLEDNRHKLDEIEYDTDLNKEYFTKKYNNLVKLIKTAIKLNEPLDFCC